MTLLSWDEKYSVGHEGIDEQHKEWLRIMNDLHSRLLNGTAESLDQVTADALKAVVQYGETHFKYEEGLMRESGYEDLAYHQSLHQDFYYNISRLYKKHVEGEIVLNSQLMKTLQNWLLEHILVEDKKFMASSSRPSK